MGKPVHAISIKYEGKTDVIKSEVETKNLLNDSKIETIGIWDTGATHSAITKSLASQLNLIEIAQTNVRGVHGKKDGVKVYYFQISLNNKNIILSLRATECDELSVDNSVGLLIGMDVITQGDFSITNLNGKTTMSFRVPSLQEIDFVEGIKRHTPMIKDKIPTQNDPCFCGSGKKYKHCCKNKK